MNRLGSGRCLNQNPRGPCRGLLGWAAKGVWGRQGRENRCVERAGARGPRARVRKRRAGSAPAAPLPRGLQGRASGQVPVPTDSWPRRPLACGGIRREKGRRCRRRSLLGAGCKMKARVLSLCFPGPGIQQAPQRCAGFRGGGPGSSLPTARLTRGPRSGSANSQGLVRCGRRLEPRDPRPRSAAQPEKLAAAAQVGPASP